MLLSDVVTLLRPRRIYSRGWIVRAIGVQEHHWDCIAVVSCQPSVACGRDGRLERRLLTVILPHYATGLAWAGRRESEPTVPHGLAFVGAARRGRVSASPSARQGTNTHAPNPL